MPRRAAILAAPALILLPTARAQAARLRVGDVEAVTGRALAHFESEPPRPLAPASAVLLDDLLATDPDARLAARLATGIEIRLGGNATLRVDRMALGSARRGILLQSLSGPLSFDRPPAEGARTAVPVTLDLPWARIAVRGTRFFAGPLDEVFAVFCARGSVLVIRPGAWQVRLGPGDGVDVPRVEGHVPEPPVRQWGQARIQRAFALVQ
jgi:ferric-dicitrate binding protein FerR (iron transport regulator)